MKYFWLAAAIALGTTQVGLAGPAARAKTERPSFEPSKAPRTAAPTRAPTTNPTSAKPSAVPTALATSAAASTAAPTRAPTTKSTTAEPSTVPTAKTTSAAPTTQPTSVKPTLPVTATDSFCEILNQGNVLTAGLRGGGDACFNGGANVPTDACPSTMSVSGVEENYIQPHLRCEEFGRQSYEYLEYLDAQEVPPAWYQPDRLESLQPPTSRHKPIEYKFGCTGSDQTACLDGNIIRTFTSKEVRNFQQAVTDSTAPHPWEAAISNLCPSIQFGVPIHPGAPTSFADGRGFGKPFSHQRWDEFLPQRFVKSILTGATRNKGIRDGMQRHKHQGGEFSATGFHAAPTGFKLGATEGTQVRFAPSLAVQDQQSVWGFDGSWPPKMLLVRYGEPFLFRLYNGLPLAYDSNRGFGSHFISTHEHNGHNPAESDGFASAYSMPGQYYDYHWPTLLAGHDSINTNAQDPKASTPCVPLSRVLASQKTSLIMADHDDLGYMIISYQGACTVSTVAGQLRLACPTQTTTADVSCAAANGGADLSCCNAEFNHALQNSLCTSSDGSWAFVNQGPGDHNKPWHRLLMTCPDSGTIRISGDWHETMSTHWFHDHMIDHTAQNVYKGNAALQQYHSGIDRGNECWNDGVNLRLPSGCGMHYNMPDGAVGGLPNSLSWGIRDYDLYMFFNAKAWGQDTQGYVGGNLCNETNSGSDACKQQLWFNQFNTDGFLGDKMLVNLAYKPEQVVRPRRYRLRFLNADVSRFMRLAFVHERLCVDISLAETASLQAAHNYIAGPAGSGLCYSRIPFHLIANDGNIMQHAVPYDGSMDLYSSQQANSDIASVDANDNFNQAAIGDPCNRFLGITNVFAIAERLDAILDFSKHGLKKGSKVFLVNILEHQQGERPNMPLNLAGGLSMLATILAGQYTGGDGGVGKFMRFVVADAIPGATDTSMDPSQYEPPCVLNGVNRCSCPLATAGQVAGRPGLEMIPRPVHDLTKVARRREMNWVKGGAVAPADQYKDPATGLALGHLPHLAVGDVVAANVPSDTFKQMQTISALVSVAHMEAEEQHTFLTPANGCNDCIKIIWAVKTDQAANIAVRRSLLSNATQEAGGPPLLTTGIAEKAGNNNLRGHGRTLQTAPAPAAVPQLPSNIAYLADMELLSVAIDKETLELWKFTGHGGWSHNVHTHFEEGHIHSRGGKPVPMWEEGARKDVYRVGPEEDSQLGLVFSIQFRDLEGTYMTHCHNTQHEDHAMLQRWDIQHPGQTIPFMAPVQNWRGCSYQQTTEMFGA